MFERYICMSLLQGNQKSGCAFEKEGVAVMKRGNITNCKCHFIGINRKLQLLTGRDPHRSTKVNMEVVKKHHDPG